MKTRREFLAGLAALPFLAKLELPVPKRKLPTMRALQAIADNFLAPKIANDVSFHAPSCSDFRTKAYPHPAKPGWQFVTTWTYQGFRRAFSSASIDPADFKTNDVASIVDMIDVVRQNMTLAAIDFMEQEGATEKHEGNSAEAVSQ